MDFRFPSDLPASKWVEFETTVGLNVPVSGVVYRDCVCEPSVLGDSVGTVCIHLGTDGTIDYHNATLGTLPMALLGQPPAAYCAASGLAGRIMRAARV